MSVEYCSIVKFLFNRNVKRIILVKWYTDKHNHWMHIILFCFSPPFVGRLEELSKDKVCHCYICLNFLLSGKFAAPLWVSTAFYLCVMELEVPQSKLLRVRNFQGLCWWLLWWDYLCPGALSAFPKGTGVDLVDPYLFCMLRPSNHHALM